MPQNVIPISTQPGVILNFDSTKGGLFNRSTETRMGTVWAASGAPVNGTSGTYANHAAAGDLLITDEPAFYQNTNTSASPTWTALTSATGAGTYTGTFDGKVGNSTPAAGKFTTLSASDTVTLSPTGKNVVMSPSGAGVVTVAPNTAGTMDNMAIGGTTPLAGKFTTLDATSTVTLSPANKNVVASPSGTGVVTIAPNTSGSMNNMAVGDVTPLTGVFTTLVSTVHTERSVGNGLTAIGSDRGGSLALTKDVNNVTTAATGTGVTLPTGVIGMEVDVYIDSGVAGAAVQVYAAGSETIDTVAGATGVPLTKGKRCRFTFVAANTWISAQWGVVSA